MHLYYNTAVWLQLQVLCFKYKNVIDLQYFLMIGSFCAWSVQPLNAWLLFVTDNIPKQATERKSSISLGQAWVRALLPTHTADAAPKRPTRGSSCSSSLSQTRQEVFPQLSPQLAGIITTLLLSLPPAFTLACLNLEADPSRLEILPLLHWVEGTRGSFKTCFSFTYI